MKSRISWSKETYKRGRAPIAKIDIKGKSLIMWLALDPAEFENTKYHFKDVSDRRIGESYPMLIKVRSPRSLKYALELIAKLMETLGIERIEREFEDFHREYLTDEVLIEMGLIKVMLSEEEAARYLKGETLRGDYEDGWTVVVFGGYPLGWAKAVKGQLKNKYLKGWMLS